MTDDVRQVSLATVVIPVRNGASTIGEQLGALSRQTYAGAWEVVIADNGSTDGTQELCRSWADRLPQLRVVDASDVAGSSHARNVGADEAAGEVLAFCDADDVVAEQWLERLIDALARHDLVGGPQETDRLNDDTVRSWRSSRPQDSLNVASGFLAFAPTSNLGVWTDVYHRVGGLSDDYIQSHDVEFSWRAQLAGFDLGFAPGAVVHYRYRDTMKGIARQAYVSGLDAAQLYRDFRDAGLRRDSPAAMARGWLWLLARLPWLADRRRRGTYVRRAATLGGKVVGSVRFRVAYL